MIRSDLSKRRHWLIVRDEGRLPEVLTVDIGEDREALPIFGHQEEADMFLLLGEQGAGWQVKEVGRAELASELIGLRASVEKVAMDPLPPRIAGREFADLVSIDRGDFARVLLGERSLPSPATRSEPGMAPLRGSVGYACGSSKNRGDATTMEFSPVALPPETTALPLAATTASVRGTEV